MRITKKSVLVSQMCHLCPLSPLSCHNSVLLSFPRNPRQYKKGLVKKYHTVFHSNTFHNPALPAPLSSHLIRAYFILIVKSNSFYRLYICTSISCISVSQPLFPRVPQRQHLDCTAAQWSYEINTTKKILKRQKLLFYILDYFVRCTYV